MDNCWEAIVDTWLSEEYEQYHAVRSRCRAMMQGSSHKQGPTTLKEYAARYTRFHPGQECASFKAYALAHKGKAKDPDLVYNPEDPPEAYSNLSVHSSLSDSSPAIRPHSQPQVVALQAQIEALQESQQASQSQFQALQLSHQAELAQERARVQAQLEAFQQSQKAWYEYMASFSQSMGQPPPPPPPPMIPLVPPPPRDGTPGPSTAGSNNDQDLDLSPFLGRAPTM
ncbi:uncharacterized protein [Miscanthus floridulus]|uniref:uncharacterized protein n=1 Tax=Miscanthus floridulus TaxID=154761 RepID=UPI003457B20D